MSRKRLLFGRFAQLRLGADGFWVVVALCLSTACSTDDSDGGSSDTILVDDIANDVPGDTAEDTTLSDAVEDAVVSDGVDDVSADESVDSATADEGSRDASAGDASEETTDAVVEDQDETTDGAVDDQDEAADAADRRMASFTWYISYAACCPDNENYDPEADTTECDLYSACDYPGLFAGFEEQVSLEWVQSHTLVAFFDTNYPTIAEWRERYANKIIRLTRGEITVDALIADTCADSDCGGCCTANASPSGALVDMEYWSVLANFGDLAEADGQIEFEILENCGGLALDDCGVCGGDNATCVPLADACARCMDEGASCYVKGWTEPCMNSTRLYCLEEVEDYPSFWCPDHL